MKEELIASLGEEITDSEKKLAKKYYEDLKWEVVDSGRDRKFFGGVTAQDAGLRRHELRKIRI